MKQLKPVTIDDAMLLYQWANDPITRSNSFNPAKIDYSSHEKFVNTKIQSQNTLWYILTVDQISAGQVRLECDGTVGTIHYSIGPDFRGKGYGKDMLEKLECIAYENGIRVLVGDVKNTNIASQHVFEKLHYKAETQGENIRFTKDMSCTEKE